MTTSCPPLDQLRESLGGSSPAGEQTELIAHLDECAACQRTLETLAGATPTLLSAAADLHRNAFVEEASRRRVLDDLARHATLTILYHSDHRTPSIRTRPRPAIALDSLGPFDHYQVTELLG